MDPHYSVLLGDDNIKDECGNLVDSPKSKNKGLKIIAIVVPIVVVVTLVAVGLLVYFAPKYDNL